MTSLLILVFSDSHRSMNAMYQAVDRYAPRQIIHLGDMEEDAELLSRAFPQIPVCHVPGNCDGWGVAPVKKRIVLGGKVFLLAHGHNWHVKSGYEYAIADARKARADVLLFGHTHIPYCRQMDDGLWVLNPGTARSSCGIITLENSALSCRLERI